MCREEAEQGSECYDDDCYYALCDYFISWVQEDERQGEGADAQQGKHNVMRGKVPFGFGFSGLDEKLAAETTLYGLAQDLFGAKGALLCCFCVVVGAYWCCLHCSFSPLPIAYLNWLLLTLFIYRLNLPGSQHRNDTGLDPLLLHKPILRWFYGISLELAVSKIREYFA
jgi:hypothetical protein